MVILSTNKKNTEKKNEKKNCLREDDVGKICLRLVSIIIFLSGMWLFITLVDHIILTYLGKSFIPENRIK